MGSGWVVVGPGRSCGVLVGPGGSYWVLLGPGGSCWVLLGPAGSWCVLLGPAGSCWVLEGQRKQSPVICVDPRRRGKGPAPACPRRGSDVWDSISRQGGGDWGPEEALQS